MKILLLAVMLFDVESFIRGELQRRGAKFSDLEISSTAALTPADGPFEVAQIQYDPVHAKTYFEIRDAHKHSYQVGVSGKIAFPTLIVSHELTSGAITSSADFATDYRPYSSFTPPALDEVTGRSTRRKVAAGELVRPEMFASSIAGVARNIPLVESGRLAILKVEGAGFAVSTPVIPMESGIAGQTVRVKTKENGRIVKAVVVDRDLLKGEGQ